MDIEQEINEIVKNATLKIQDAWLVIKTNIPLTDRELTELNHQALNKLGEILNRKRWLG